MRFLRTRKVTGSSTNIRSGSSCTKGGRDKLKKRKEQTKEKIIKKTTAAIRLRTKMGTAR